MKFTATLIVLFLSALQLRAQVVWSTDVAPILYNNCTVCHHDGGIGPFSLMEYSQVVVMGPLVQGAVLSGQMPPWPPDTEYSNFAHERILSEEEIETINAWVNTGMEEGDQALAPPPPVYSSDGFIDIEPDLEISMPEHTSTATPSGDDYSCFSIPTNLLQDKKLRAFEVIPGNPEIVHHALVFVDPNGTYTTNTSGNCMGPAGGLMGGYTPGATPTIFPSDGEDFNLGVDIPAGSNIVLAMHYPNGSQGETDQTRLRMWFYPDETSIRPVSTESVLQNWVFYLPPNQITTVEADFDDIPVDISLLSVFPHMHLLGSSIESHAILPSSEEVPLVRINNWDFHWQQFFSFENLVHIPAGSTLYGSGEYDNTSGNPHNPNNPPEGVAAGLNTTDEMFLIYFQFLPYEEGDENMNLDELTQLTTDVREWQTPEGTPIGLYPNPVNTTVTFDLILDQSAVVSLYLYDLTGRMVDVVADRSILPAGSHQLQHNIDPALPNGTYVYSANIGGNLHSGRFVVRR